MKWLMGGVALAVLGVMAALSIPTTAAQEHDLDDGSMPPTVTEEEATPSEEGDATITAETEDGDATEESTTTTETATEEDGAEAADTSAEGATEATTDVVTEADASVGASSEASVIDDSECALGDLWSALDAILAGPAFPDIGAAVVVPASACEELLGMIEGATVNMEDGPSCTLADAVESVAGFEDVLSIPEVELPSQVCMTLFGTIGEGLPTLGSIGGALTGLGSITEDLPDDIPVIFAGFSTIDQSGDDSASVTVEADPAIEVP